LIKVLATGELPALASVSQSKSIGQVARDVCKCVLSEQGFVSRLFNLPPESKEVTEILDSVFSEAHVAIIALCLNEAKHDTLLYVTMLYELDSLLELCVTLAAIARHNANELYRDISSQVQRYLQLLHEFYHPNQCQHQVLPQQLPRGAAHVHQLAKDCHPPSIGCGASAPPAVAPALLVRHFAPFSIPYCVMLSAHCPRYAHIPSEFVSIASGSINPTLVRIVAVASCILQEGAKTDPKYMNGPLAFYLLSCAQNL
jgi:hypothetical protein